MEDSVIMQGEIGFPDGNPLDVKMQISKHPLPYKVEIIICVDFSRNPNTV